MHSIGPYAFSWLRSTLDSLLTDAAVTERLRSRRVAVKLGVPAPHTHVCLLSLLSAAGRSRASSYSSSAAWSTLTNTG